MRAGTETGVPVQLILLLLTWIHISSAAVLTNVERSNPLNINWDPAPPPADGPPLSAGASRDKALLPAQISGIVGAYLFSLLLVGIGIFIIGRRVRQRVEIAYNKSRDIEMLDTNLVGPNTIFGTGLQDTSPVSPLAIQTNFSWQPQEKSSAQSVPNPYVFPPTSPHSTTSPYSPTTPPSISNPNVNSQIVERDQKLMERDLEDIYAHVMEQEDAKAAGIPVEDLPAPAQLRSSVGKTPPPPSTLRSPPKKIEKLRPSNIVLPEEKPSRSSRASSIISSIISPRKSSFKKELQISSPLQSPRDPTYHQKSTAEEREPLTPRFYAPPPPPPVPKDQTPFQQSPRHKSQGSVSSQQRTIAEQLEPYGPGAPSAFPNKTSSPVSFVSQISGLPSSPKPQQSNFPPSIYSASPGSATSSNRQLPFRQFEPALTSPSYASFQQSTKTTTFERTAPDPSRGPTTGGLRTGGLPWSPGAVPYSPYQPFSPMIPITPRLVTKEDRKMMKKQEKKLKIVQSPELVEDDLWDSGY